MEGEALNELREIVAAKSAQQSFPRVSNAAAFTDNGENPNSAY